MNDQLRLWEDPATEILVIDEYVESLDALTNPTASITEMTGQCAVMMEFEAHGCPVSIARSGLAYDLIVQYGPRLQLAKIQVKATSATTTINGHAYYQFSTRRGGSNGPKYQLGEVDVFALVCNPLKRILFRLAHELPTKRADGIPKTMLIPPKYFESEDLTERTLLYCINRLEGASQ